MKRIKMFLPLIAVLIAVAGVFAMSANKASNQKIALEAWNYNGPVGQESDPGLYSLDSIGTPNHSTCELDNKTICQIIAEPDQADLTKPELNGLNPMNNQPAFQATLRGED